MKPISSSQCSKQTYTITICPYFRVQKNEEYIEIMLLHARQRRTCTSYSLWSKILKTFLHYHAWYANHCSVYQAELTATRDTNGHIIIWTDSLSYLLAIKLITIRSKTVPDCFASVRNIATSNTVELR